MDRDAASTSIRSTNRPVSDLFAGTALSARLRGHAGFAVEGTWRGSARASSSPPRGFRVKQVRMVQPVRVQRVDESPHGMRLPPRAARSRAGAIFGRAPGSSRNCMLRFESGWQQRPPARAGPVVAARRIGPREPACLRPAVMVPPRRWCRTWATQVDGPRAWHRTVTHERIRLRGRMPEYWRGCASDRRHMHGAPSLREPAGAPPARRSLEPSCPPRSGFLRVRGDRLG